LASYPLKEKAKAKKKKAMRRWFSIFVRWGGLLTLVAAALLIFTDLVALFFILFRGSFAGLFYRGFLIGYAHMLLSVGLTGLYAYQAEAVGAPGLVGFVQAFSGMALEPLHVVWPSVLASLGWMLFGASSLYAEVYSSAAAMLLIMGGGLSGIANALIVSGLFRGSYPFTAISMVVDIVFSISVGWLSLTLLPERIRKSGESHI
jgi:hypothetical protein